MAIFPRDSGNLGHVYGSPTMAHVGRHSMNSPAIGSVTRSLPCHCFTGCAGRHVFVFGIFIYSDRYLNFVCFFVFYDSLLFGNVEIFSAIGGVTPPVDGEIDTV